MVEEEADTPSNTADDPVRTGEFGAESEEDTSSRSSGLTMSENQASSYDDNDNDALESDENLNIENALETPIPQARRSTRAKTSTATTRYRDFVLPPVSKSAQPDWIDLKAATSSGMFVNMGEEVSRVMLKLIMKTGE